MRLIVTVFLLTIVCHSASVFADADAELNAPELTDSDTREFAPNLAVIATCEQIAAAQVNDSAADRQQFLRQCSAEAEQFLRQHQLITQSLSQTP